MRFAARQGTFCEKSSALCVGISSRFPHRWWAVEICVAPVAEDARPRCGCRCGSYCRSAPETPKQWCNRMDAVRSAGIGCRLVVACAGASVSLCDRQWVFTSRAKVIHRHRGGRRDQILSTNESTARHHPQPRIVTGGTSGLSSSRQIRRLSCPRMGRSVGRQ